MPASAASGEGEKAWVLHLNLFRQHCPCWGKHGKGLAAMLQEDPYWQDFDSTERGDSRATAFLFQAAPGHFRAPCSPFGLDVATEPLF